jgi:hypothetical protein
MGVPLIAAGTGLKAYGQLKAGSAAKRRGAAQKILYDIAAGQTVAAGQRAALEERRQSKLMASRALAIAAAGGAAQDVDNLIADINGEGVYRANVAMYEAETEAEKLKFEGMLAEQTGKEQKRASRIGALGTVLSGGSDIYAYKKS